MTISPHIRLVVFTAWRREPNRIKNEATVIPAIASQLY